MPGAAAYNLPALLSLMVFFGLMVFVYLRERPWNERAMKTTEKLRAYVPEIMSTLSRRAF